MNGGLTGLERHECEQLMTEYIFLGWTIPLNGTLDLNIHISFLISFKMSLLVEQSEIFD